MRSPVATFFLHGMVKIRGDPGLNNRIVSPMIGPLGRPRAKQKMMPTSCVVVCIALGVDVFRGGPCPPLYIRGERFT